MFCANCGKTLKNGASTCPHCGAPVGENHFQGLPYTAAQPKIAPGETEKLAEQFRPYTRTTYMGSGEPEGDVLSRTTYRPVLDEESASAPEDGEAPTQEAPASEGESAPEAEAAENRGNGVEALFDEPKGKDARTMPKTALRPPARATRRRTAKRKPWKTRWISIPQTST